MSQQDPLAQRHGAIISEIWTEISKARSAAFAEIAPDEATAISRDMARLRVQVEELHREELEQEKWPVTYVRDWFRPLEQTLTNAERYFTAAAAVRRFEDAVN